MAIEQNMAWRIRVDGSELNGGGFDSNYGSTDYTDQASPQLSLTDVVTNGTTTVTSVTGGFTTTMEGNVIRIAGDGYYMITARINTNTIHVDQATGTGSGQSARVGGAFADFRNLSTGGSATAPLLPTPLVAGNTIYVRAAGGSLDPSIAGTPDVDQAGYYQFPDGLYTDPITVVGYNGRPYIRCDGLMFYLPNYWVWKHLKFAPISGSLQNAGLGIISSNSVCTVKDCIFDSNGQGITHVRATKIIDNVMRNTGTSTSDGIGYYAVLVSPYNTLIINNTIDNQRGRGINCYSTIATVVGNVVTRCRYGASAITEFHTDPYAILIDGNVIDSNAGDGINLDFAHGQRVTNNQITNNGGVGISINNGLPSWNDKMLAGDIDFNNVYGNSSGGYSNFSAGANDKAVDPQYVSPIGDGGDYTPQNVLVKAATPLTLGAATNYKWIGAIQPTGGVTPTPQYFYNRAKKELLNGTMIPLTSDLRGMLVDSTYTFDADLQTIDNGTGSDPQSHELAGGTRIIITGRSVAEDDTNDFGYMIADDVVFPGITTGQTLGGMVVYRNVSGDDTQSAPIAFYPLTLSTDGRSVHVTFALAVAGGALKAA